ncbi:MAG: P-loop NTPase [Bryobacteraceae bacterium]
MLSLGLVTPNSIAAQAIEQLVNEMNGFTFAGSTKPEASVSDVTRMLRSSDPDLILVDLNDWANARFLVEAIPGAKLKGKIIGFRESWTREEQLEFAEAGVQHLLREPFSPADLDDAIYTVLHCGEPIPKPGVIAFLPAKAGGGCSTVALHAAAALGASGKKVLLVEADIRSGAYSLMLNVKSPLSLQDVLQRTGDLTPVEWQRMYVSVEGIDLLLADPAKPAFRASWTGYHQLLHFARKIYDYVVVDLPEVVNDATAEVARTAETVFVVCTPEILSLRLASLRCQEVEAYGVSSARIKAIINRYLRDGIGVADIERSIGRPVFATLVNDYGEVHHAIMEYRVASPASAFAKDCRVLAQKINGEVPPVEKSRFGSLLKFGR